MNEKLRQYSRIPVVDAGTVVMSVTVVPLKIFGVCPTDTITAIVFQ